MPPVALTLSIPYPVYVALVSIASADPDATVESLARFALSDFVNTYLGFPANGSSGNEKTPGLSPRVVESAPEKCP